MQFRVPALEGGNLLREPAVLGFKRLESPQDGGRVVGRETKVCCPYRRWNPQRKTDERRDPVSADSAAFPSTSDTSAAAIAPPASAKMNLRIDELTRRGF